MKKVKSTLLKATAVLSLFCTACRKEAVTPSSPTPVIAATTGYIQYIIPKGEHYSTGNIFKPIDKTELNFVVRFDSSCIYTSVIPENQDDIHKLFGFSDNNAQHHSYSARIGWRWSKGALRLFGYTYNNGVRQEKEISTVPINAPISCSIKIVGSNYQFTVNETQLMMERQSATATAKGYQLYPYFGGDETAPHEIRIWLKEN